MPPVKIIRIEPTEEDGPELHLTFLPAPDDPDYRERAYQNELEKVEQSLQASVPDVQSVSYFQKSATGGSWLTGEFIMYLSALGTPLGALLGSWITAKFGRKVKIKVDDIEVEAANLEQIDELLNRVREFKAENDKPL